MALARETALADVADHIGELTRPTVHIQVHWLWIGGHEQRREYRWRHRSLLDQLRAAADPTRGAGLATIRAASADPPDAADLAAVDCLAAIAEGVAGWRGQFQLRGRGRLELDLWALVGVAATRPAAMVEQFAEDVARWRSWARTTVGWGRAGDDTPTPEPDALPQTVTCPLCGAADSLRIRPTSMTARCAACRARWTPDNIGLLARHIRGDTVT